MAKALLGHVGSDHLLHGEVLSLRARVRQLEAEVDGLRRDLAAQPVALDSAVDVKDANLHAELAGLDHATPALA
ncbi:MAG: hypothetical protein ACOYD0_02115 [Candidatus Nanopelagicales bacterium]